VWPFLVQQIRQPPFSLDIAHWNLFLVSKLKKSFERQNVNDDMETN
jgi:hypothetical protein